MARVAGSFTALLRDVRRKPWVLYSKPPMAGPEQVLKYLARYTHRVAIANSRLLSLEDGRVSFRYKDYAQGGRQRLMSLDGVGSEMERGTPADGELARLVLEELAARGIGGVEAVYVFGSTATAGCARTATWTSHS